LNWWKKNKWEIRDLWKTPYQNCRTSCEMCGKILWILWKHPMKCVENCGNIYELCGKDWLILWNIFETSLDCTENPMKLLAHSFFVENPMKVVETLVKRADRLMNCGKTYDSCGKCLWTSYEMYGRFLWILWRNIWVLWKSYDFLSKVNENHIHFVDFSNMSTEKWDLAASGFLQDFNLLLWISPFKINVKPLHDVNAQGICIKDH
jgi:hypothetical protein